MHRIDPLPDWALSRARMMNNFDAVEPTRAALVVVDLQVSFLSSGKMAATTFGLPIMPKVNTLIAAARTAGSPVVFLRQTFGDEPGVALAPWQKEVAPPIEALRRTLRPGEPGHAVHPDLDIQPGDLIIDKYRHSAFARDSSNLDEALRERAIDTLIITGAMTNFCCEATARDAYALGFRVFFISDATAALSNEEHNAALLNLALCCADVRDTESMLVLIEAACSPGQPPP